MNKLFILLALLTFMACNNEKAHENPLLGDFNTPHGTAPFDKIDTADYLPAFEVALAEGKAEVASIIDNEEEPSFENTIEALEYSGQLLGRTAGIFFNLLSANTSDKLQDIAQTVSPMLTEFQNDISLNPALFQRVKKVYEQKDSLNLSGEQLKLLEDNYFGFVRSGANLNDTDKDQYRKISEELSKLQLDFGNHVLAETNAYSKHITDKAMLAGLPQSAIDAAAMKAKQKDKEGYLIDISMPSFLPIMQYADNRDLRQEIYMAYGTKAAKDNENDNRDVVKRIVELRLQKAKILGYKTYANYVLQKQMAEKVDNVYGLLDDLLEASMPVALKEKEAVQNLATSLGLKGDLMPWDWGYYSEKLKDQKFNLNDEMLKPYFKLENVIDGVFGLATELYGITFKENRDIPIYHNEVIPYEVFDEDGSFLAVLYADFHPRESKRGGAWMNDFIGQYKQDGVDHRPNISIVMNFTPSTETAPSLLTFNELETFLHEFGHALHGMFASSTYGSLSGTNVYRDFVELPSQIMENWAVEKEFLDRFAVHYETGEKIPAELVAKIRESNNFNSGYASVRQLSFGYLDMAWHTLEEPYSGDVEAFEDAAWSKTQLFPSISSNIMTSQFGHLFAGGYAAGYYGYKWAEVLDADAFSMFKKNGLFDKETARSFRKNILEKGGTEHPMDLYKAFRGQEPTVDALKERNGLSVKF